MSKKQEFIGNYLNEKLKDHNLPYGMQYLSLLAQTEEDAEKAWKAHRKSTGQIISFETVNGNNYTIIPKKDIAEANARISKEIKKVKRKYNL